MIGVLDDDEFLKRGRYRGEILPRQIGRRLPILGPLDDENWDVKVRPQVAQIGGDDLGPKVIQGEARSLIK
jgi:hypothetical protein